MSSSIILRSFTFDAGDQTLVEQYDVPSKDVPFRFPSVEERVKYYMGDWYNRRIETGDHDDISKICSALYAVNMNISRNGPGDSQEILFNVQNIIHQVKTNSYHVVGDYLEKALRVMRASTTFSMDDAIILTVKDGHSQKEFMPTISKTRPSCLRLKSTNTNITNQKSSWWLSSCSGMIWPLNTVRHFENPLKLYIKLNSTGKVTPWDKKISTLIFRGAFTGVPQRDLGFMLDKTPFEYGERVHAVVEMSKYNKTDIDAGFSRIQDKSLKPKFRKYTKGRMSMEKALRYKYFLNLEGNDVSTGLKWQLASNSVVFMPKPKTVSFAMEDILVPFVHYIPLKDDFSDVMEMLEWARSHDDECRWISEQATEYMKRLWMSEEAKMENDLVMANLAERYQKQFGPAVQECFRMEEEERQE